MLKASDIAYAAGNRTLIKEISIEFQPGNLFGILGPNGSGKTTFMKVLAGLWQPSHGQIRWNDLDLLALSRKQISNIVTFVPQNPQLTFEYIVEDFVAMARYAHADVKKHLIKDSLELVNAWHLRDRQVQHLSSGERQRVYIARALATEAPVLLLDEPTASLDIRHQLEIWRLLQSLVKNDKIVIVTNHDLEATRRFCDRVAVFHQGTCLKFGSNKEIIVPELIEEVFGVNERDVAFLRE